MPTASAVASQLLPPATGGVARTAFAPPPGNALGFGLFLLVNVVLFVRPGDVVPALIGDQIYQYLTLLCLAVSFPTRMEQLGERLLAAKEAYFQQRSHDDKLFGDEFRP